MHSWLWGWLDDSCHFSSRALLGAVEHEVGLDREYMVSDTLPGKESVTALQGSEGRQARLESHLHPLALDSKRSTKGL